MMKNVAQEVRKMFDQIALADHENSETIQKLPGDASTRMYYRLRIDGKSYVLMKMEAFEDHGLRLPFLEVQSHLRNAGIDVPQVID
ncbi:MAG: phosphotransferase, partial [Bdellovibrionota bacterium]